MPLQVKAVTGVQALPYLTSLANLRLRVFRDWPYLYDGNLAYEEDYLLTYANAKNSIVVVAMQGGQVIGCATGILLAEETETCQAPFLQAGIDPNQVFYFGESVLLPAYRRQGVGHAFFDERERFARSVSGVKQTAFCAIQRDAADPRKPAEHFDLEPFWQSRGYKPDPSLRANFFWKELDEAAESSKPMLFWTRPL